MEMWHEQVKEEPLCISIPAAAKLLGISRATAYSMARLGQLPIIRCGQRRMLVPMLRLRKMLEQDTNSLKGGKLDG